MKSNIYKLLILIMIVLSIPSIVTATCVISEDGIKCERCLDINNGTECEYCKDTDAGKNYYIKGTISTKIIGPNYGGGSYPKNDTCEKDVLTEYYCDSVELKSINYVCPNGCKDGVCIEEPKPTCEDSDNGLNYYVKGVTFGFSGRMTGNFNDFCSNNDAGIGTVSSGDYIHEYLCEDNLVVGKTYKCPYKCEDGKCLPKCEGINMVWGIGRSEPYSYIDQCDGYRCLKENSISPSCYNYNECVNSCSGECINIKNAKEECVNIQPKDCSELKNMDSCVDNISCYWDEETDKCYIFDETKQQCKDLDNGRDGYEKSKTYGFRYWLNNQVYDIPGPYGDERDRRVRIEREDNCPTEQSEGVVKQERVVEYYCNGEYIYTTYVDCEGTKCQDGVCMKKEDNSTEEGTDIENETIIEENDEEICMGCVNNENCLPFGTRLEGKYCNLSKNMIHQKQANSFCENNYECDSNLCISDKCVSSSIWNRFIRWFSKFFSR